MATKIVFRHQYDERLSEGSKEVFTEPSMTEPENALSIPEIIARFTRGQGLQVQQYPMQSGVAPEFGEPQNDMTLEDVMEFVQPAGQPAVQPAAQPAAQLAAALPAGKPAEGASAGSAPVEGSEPSAASPAGA